MLLVLLAHLLSVPASAADAYYHPSDVAAKSQVFVLAAERMGPAFDKAQQQLGVISVGLEQLELGIILLGDDVSEADRGFFDTSRRNAIGQSLQLQKHVDLLQDDYANVFGQALERAIAGLSTGQELAECGGASGINALINRPTCDGENLNAALASTIDADPALLDAVKEINALPWPALTHPEHTMTVIPITGDAYWISTSALLNAFLSDAVARHQDDLNRALAPLEDALESGAEDAHSAALRHRNDYERRITADGQVLRAAVQGALDRVSRKDTIPGEIGLCPNPATFGACAGEDITANVIALLREDRKFSKAIATLQ